MADSAAVGSENRKASFPKDLMASDVVSAYRIIAAHAALVAGNIGIRPAGDTTLSAAQNIRTEWSQRDIDRKEKTRFSKMFCLLQDADKLYCVGSSVPQEICHVLWDLESASGRRRAVVLKKKDHKGEDRQFVEIWNMKQKEKTIDIKALDKHGDIVGSDGQFGSMQWSRCEDYLLYIAERKVPKTASFFEVPASKEDSKEKGDNSEGPLKGGEYLYRESWGEQLAERHMLMVCRLTISSGVVTMLSTLPDHLCPGQAVWGPDSCVVFTAWSSQPFRLGLKFSTNRRSCLFKASFDDGECELLSEEGRAVRSPSFSPDLSRLVYLDTPEGGPHNQCSRLVMINWRKREELENKAEARQVIVDIVSSPYKAGQDPVMTSGQEEFPGLYTWTDQEARQNWLGDSVHVLLTSYWRSCSTVVIVNTDTKVVRRLNPYDPFPFRLTPTPAAIPVPVVSPDQATATPSFVGSISDSCAWACSLLDVRGMDVLLSCSWPNTPPFPVMGRLCPGESWKSQWVTLGDAEAAPLPLYDWKILTLNPADLQAQHRDFDYLHFEAILYLPVMEEKENCKPPLVLFPHGGPHSVFDCTFAFNPAVFACCGFAVLCVNYRGSLGFGQDSISSLLGNVGNLDVKDCMVAMQAVQKAGLVDPDNSFVYGGSHGGFLSAHLIGQYPDTFRAASMRNPVTNLTSKMGGSDLPDTVFTETGLPFDFGTLATADILSTLWSASPVSHVDKVKTPVMLHIGLKDLRVPPSQGLEYCKMLKARNVPVQCHTYPDSNHSLSEIEVEADSLLNSILWFAKHLSHH